MGRIDAITRALNSLKKVGIRAKTDTDGNDGLSDWVAPLEKTTIGDSKEAAYASISGRDCPSEVWRQHAAQKQDYQQVLVEQQLRMERDANSRPQKPRPETFTSCTVKLYPQKQPVGRAQSNPWDLTVSLPSFPSDSSFSSSIPSPGNTSEALFSHQPQGSPGGTGTSTPIRAGQLSPLGDSSSSARPHPNPDGPRVAFAAPEVESARACAVEGSGDTKGRGTPGPSGGTDGSGADGSSHGWEIGSGTDGGSQHGSSRGADGPPHLYFRPISAMSASPHRPVGCTTGDTSVGASAFVADLQPPSPATPLQNRCYSSALTPANSPTFGSTPRDAPFRLPALHHTSQPQRQISVYPTMAGPGTGCSAGPPSDGAAGGATAARPSRILAAAGMQQAGTTPESAVACLARLVTSSRHALHPAAKKSAAGSGTSVIAAAAAIPTAGGASPAPTTVMVAPEASPARNEGRSLTLAERAVQPQLPQPAGSVIQRSPMAMQQQQLQSQAIGGSGFTGGLDRPVVSLAVGRRVTGNVSAVATPSPAVATAATGTTAMQGCSPSGAAPVSAVLAAARQRIEEASGGTAPPKPSPPFHPSCQSRRSSQTWSAMLAAANGSAGSSDVRSGASIVVNGAVCFRQSTCVVLTGVDGEGSSHGTRRNSTSDLDDTIPLNIVEDSGRWFDAGDLDYCNTECEEEMAQILDDLVQSNRPDDASNVSFSRTGTPSGLPSSSSCNLVRSLMTQPPPRLLTANTALKNAAASAASAATNASALASARSRPPSLPASCEANHISDPSSLPAIYNSCGVGAVSRYGGVRRNSSIGGGGPGTDLLLPRLAGGCGGSGSGASSGCGNGGVGSAGAASAISSPSGSASGSPLGSPAYSRTGVRHSATRGTMDVERRAGDSDDSGGAGGSGSGSGGPEQYRGGGSVGGGGTRCTAPSHRRSSQLLIQAAGRRASTGLPHGLRAMPPQPAPPP